MRTREHFEIKRSARRYDRTTGNFIINISYETATEVTPRTIAVAEAFGLGVDQHQRHIVYDNVELKISPTDVVLVTMEKTSIAVPHILQHTRKPRVPSPGRILSIMAEINTTIPDTTPRIIPIPQSLRRCCSE